MGTLTAREAALADAIKTAAVVVFDDADRVLLVSPGPASEHPAGTFGLPAGRLRDGETHGQCAVRECAEETGLVIERGALLGLETVFMDWVERRDGSRRYMTMVVFATRAFSGELRTSEEAIPSWHSRNEIKRLKLQLNVETAVGLGYLALRDHR